MATALRSIVGQTDVASERRTIPFDFAFPFDLAHRNQLIGKPNTVHNATVSVSIEASFMAVAIGFGVIPSVTPVRIVPQAPVAAPIAASPSGITGTITNFAVTTNSPHGYSPGERVTITGTSVASVNSTWMIASVSGPRTFTVNLPLGVATGGGGAASIVSGQDGSLSQYLPFLDSVAAALQESAPSATGTIGPKTAMALRAGVRINPELADAVLNQDVTQALQLDEIFQVVSPGIQDVQFKYAIFDEGTGREFQSEPILSTAGLGISNGERPFRYFAKPIEFLPRSTIRIQVTEVSDFQGDLHISLQGYKVLGGAGTPTGRIRRRLGTSGRR
jgi:hypothetical protein